MPDDSSDVPRTRGGIPKQLGSRRYRQDIAALSRTRTGILLDTDLAPEDAARAIAEIDALQSTLATLARQKESREEEETGT
jgi:hypothetical protein